MITTTVKKLTMQDYYRGLRRIRANNHREENRGEYNDYQKKYIEGHKESIKRTKKLFNIKIKEDVLQINYRLSKYRYVNMFERQKGCCAICSKEIKSSFNPEVTISNGAKIDHNHETGKVRALLCNRCNFSVGTIETNIHLISKVREYIVYYNNNGNNTRYNRLSKEEYISMFSCQNEKCSICCEDIKSKFNEELKCKKMACIDHDHKTGYIRSLLCNGCNYLVGLFEKSPEITNKIIEYLALHNTKESTSSLS